MKLQTYQTNALTRRMLVDGSVHPRLVGYDSEMAVLRATQALIDNGGLRRDDYGAFEVVTTQDPEHPNYKKEVNVIS